jgi:hypothetical protein
VVAGRGANRVFDLRRLVDHPSRRSSTDAFDKEPIDDIAWSADSSAIAFTRGLGLYAVGANGDGLRRLLESFPFGVSWDPVARSVPPRRRLAPPAGLTWIYDRRGRRGGFVVRKFTAEFGTRWATSCVPHRPAEDECGQIGDRTSAARR